MPDDVTPCPWCGKGISGQTLLRKLPRDSEIVEQNGKRQISDEKRPEILRFQVFLVGLSETFSKNYKIIRDYVKHHASTPVNTNVDPTITDQSYNSDYIVKSIKQQQKTLTEFEIQSVIQKYQNGASSYDLAKEFGCHRRTITDTLKRNGVEVSHQAATKPELVKRIIELYAEMKTPKEVGAIAGINEGTVRQILKKNNIHIRRSWEYPRSK